MKRSIAEGRVTTPLPDAHGLDPLTIIVGVVIACAALVLYAISNPVHLNQYNHFVWQADAFLHGRDWFPYPVPDGTGQPGNWYFQDVYPLTDAGGVPDGRALLPFPPLPALVLVPFVWLFGLFADQEGVGILLAAAGVGIAYWMLGRLPIRPAVRILTTILFATGTVWWWSAAVGSTWYFAHLVAVDIALVAVGVSLGADRLASVEDPWDEAEREADRLDLEGSPDRRAVGGLTAGIWPLDRSQVLAGFLLGLAATARLPLVFAAPWLMMVGGAARGPVAPSRPPPAPRDRSGRCCCTRC